MTEIVSITLENEMDLVLAHRRSMRVAEKIGLTTATQTTFATAVSEIARSVIDLTNDGVLEIGIEQNKQRFALVAMITFNKEIKFDNSDEGFYYAQKLVPSFEFTESDGSNKIEMKIGLPRSLNMDRYKISELKNFFFNEPPINAYEEIKKRNIDLHKIAGEQEEEIRRSKIIDEKKNEFISVASHEIKTPITIIKAFAQMAKAAKEGCSERVKGILDKIDTQSSKLLSLVQQLLDIAKMENGNLAYSMEKITLNSYILETIGVMKHLIPEHEVITSLGEDVEINIDKLRMEQVFSNLLGNAAKYSKPNTPIKIGSVIGDDGFVEISVTDQGKGMSAKSMKSIFNKFYRTEDVIMTHSGLGMGLYIASKIVSDHGGKIWAESIEGSGSTFFFTMPVIASPN